MANSEKVCRTCFNVSEEVVPLSDLCENYLTSREMLEYLLGTKLVVSSQDFQTICRPCQKKLMTGYSFKYQSLAFEKKIKEIITRKSKIKKEGQKPTTAEESDDPLTAPQEIEYLETEFEEEKYQIPPEEDYSEGNDVIEEDVTNEEVPEDVAPSPFPASPPATSQQQEQSEKESLPVTNRRKKFPNGYKKKAKPDKRDRKRNYADEDEKLRRCTKCNLFFNGYYEHQKHYRMTHEKQVLCPECGKNILKRYFAAHMSSTHRGEKNYACEFCDKRYAQVGGLNNHRRIHTGETPYACVLCDKRFAQSFNLQEHKRRDHNIIDDISMGKTSRTYKCGLCNKHFGRSVHLKRHEEVHAKNLPFKCPACPMRFTTPGERREHVSVHENDNIDLTASNKDSLSEIGKVFPFDSDNTCSECGESFSSVEKLRLHMSEHVVASYACSVCQQNFTSSMSLHAHMKRHLRAEEYKCPVCPKTYMWSHHMRKHIKSAHPGHPIPTENEFLALKQTKNTVNLLRVENVETIEEELDKDEEEDCYVEYLVENE